MINRNHSQVDELVQYLDNQHVAVNTKRKIDIFALPFPGENIINILRYLNMEMDSYLWRTDELLFEIMHYDFLISRIIEVFPNQAWQ